jgi:hypothetical protein
VSAPVLRPDAERLLDELGHLVELRFGKTAAGARYLLSHLRELLLVGSQGREKHAEVLPEIELTLDQIEDVIEALGVKA